MNLSKIRIRTTIKIAALFFCLVLPSRYVGIPIAYAADPIIIDHRCTDITQIPQWVIEQAKANLHIAYGHTSHGSQLTTGMTGLVGFANDGGLGLSLPSDIFAWSNGGAGSKLDLHDYFTSGDLGSPDRTSWAQRTRTYLDSPANADVNVIVWSWCGEVDTTKENIDLYLSLMSQLETDYPNVQFVYMTGHANGKGETGNVHLRNQQIRNYCETNGKILYDFYDIECYDPDGNYFGDRFVLDSCGYDKNGDGDPWNDGANWAIEWQNSHVVGVDWYNCESAHSEPLNANRKAYAAWWLWGRLAGWNGLASDDADGDGIADNEDNCPLRPNPGQEDRDQDGIGDVCDEPADLTCTREKVDAASKLIKAVIACRIKVTKNQEKPYQECVDKTLEKFRAKWDKAEGKAIRKEKDCATVSTDYIEGLIEDSIKDICEIVFESANLEDRRVNKFTRDLLKVSSKKCIRLLSAEKKYSKNKKGDELDKAREKAGAIFNKKWDGVQDKAEIKGVLNKPSKIDIENIIDYLSSEISAAFDIRSVTLPF